MRPVLRRRLRQLARWGVRLGMVAAVVAGLLLFALHSSWGRDWVRGQIQSALEASLDGKVTIGALEGSLLGTPTLRRIEIQDARGNVVVRVAAAEVDYELWPVLSGETLHLRSLRLSRPEVTLAHAADGTWNLARVFAGKPRPPSLGPAPTRSGVVIDVLTARDGIFVFEDGGQRATVEGIAFEAALEGALTIKLSKNLTGHWKEGGREVLVTGSLHTDASGLSLADTRVAVGGSSMLVHALAGSSLDDLHGSADVKLHGEDFVTLWPQLPRAASMDLTVNATHEAGPTPLHVVVSGKLSGLGLESEAVVNADVACAKGRVQGKLHAQNRQFDGEASGGLVFDHGRVTFDQVVVHVDSDPLVVLPWTLGVGRLDGRVSGTYPALTIDADLKADSVTQAAAPLGPIRVELHTTDLGRTVRAMLHMGSPTGPFALDAEVNGSLSSTLATVRIVHAHARTWRIGWDADGGDVIWRRDAATSVHGLHLASSAGRVDVDGELDGDKPLELGLRGLDFARLRQGLALHGVPVAGRASGHATIVGKLAAPTVTLAADVTGVTLVAGARAFAARVRARVQAGRATLTAKLDGGGGMAADVSLAARVPVALFDPAGWRGFGGDAVDDAHVSASNVVLADLWSVLGLKSDFLGRVTRLEARLARRGGQPAATLSAHVEHFRPRTSPSTIDGSVDAALERGVVTLHVAASDPDVGEVDASAEANAPRDLFAASAWRAWRPAALRSAELTLRRVDLEAALPLLGRAPDLMGHVTGELRLQPGARGVEAHVQIERGCVRRWSTCVEQAVLQASMSAGKLVARGSALLPFAKVELDVSDARVPADPFDLAAWRALDDRAVRTATVSTDDLDLARLAPDARIAGRAQATVRFQPDGLIVVDVHAHDVATEHNQRKLGGSLHLELAEASATAHLDTTLGQDKLVRADGTLALGRALLRRSPALAPILAAAAHVDAHVDALPVKVAAEERGLPATLVKQLGGIIHAGGTLDGSLGAPVLAAHVDLEHPKVSTVTFSKLGGTWSWQAGRHAATLDASQQGGGTLVASLAAGAGAPTEAPLTAHAFSLAGLPAIVRAGGGEWLRDASGLLEADLHASGSAEAPMLKGFASVTHGTLELRDVLPPLHDVSIRIIPAGANVTLHAESKGERKSKLLLDGNADLDGWIPREASFLLRSEGLHVVVANWPVIADVNAGVYILHDRVQHLWDIKAEVRGSAVELLGSVARPASFRQLEDVVVEDPEQRAHDMAPGESLHLYVHAKSRELHVKYDETIAEAGGTFTLDHAANRTTTSGEIDVLGGTADVNGTSYDILEGHLSLPERGGSPGAYALLQHQYSSLLLTIRINTLAKKTMQLESDPPRSEEELMQVILGGNPDLPDPGTTTPSTTALSVLATLALGELTPLLKNRLVVGIDEVGSRDAPTRRYSVGTWIRRNVFVNLRSRSTAEVNENTTEGQLQWHLGHGFLFELIVGDKAGGGDILWIWRP